MTARVIHGDCLDAMREMPDANIDAIVTDPPYGLSFMGRDWDHGVPGPAFWTEALRVAKPGAHLVAFGGTRTYHRLAVAIEDAGWEIRDCLSWLYGSGFPKSLDVSKAIDRAAGAERETIGSYVVTGTAAKGKHKGRVAADSDEGSSAGFSKELKITAPATDAARQWQGWGTALKPAWEPIILARKPLVGTVAANLLAHGTGAINVDACRIETADDLNGGAYAGLERRRDGYASNDSVPGAEFLSGLRRGIGEFVQPPGRWPANVALDEEAAAMLGEPARFFYTAKASRSERNDGCDGIEARPQDPTRDVDAPGGNNPRNRGAAARVNSHPTVKPVALMRWLVRMVTPPGGVVLDPFCGSGTTLVAAIKEGFDCIGIEREAEYVAIIEARVAAAQQRPQRVAKPKPKRQPVKVQPAATSPSAQTASAPLPGQLALAWGAE